MADQSDESLARDLLRGTKAISEYIGEDPRRVYSLLQRNLLPCRKEGAVWVSSRSALRRHYQIDNTPAKTSA
jgi:hypothetical protein